MISAPVFFTYLAVMAGVTYLIRMVPLVLCRKKITNRFIRSFLHYIPYAVLGAMTFPAIFTSTSFVASAIAGLITAAVLAYFEKGLLLVSASACGAVLVCELILINSGVAV